MSDMSQQHRMIEAPSRAVSCLSTLPAGFSENRTSPRSTRPSRDDGLRAGREVVRRRHETGRFRVVKNNALLGDRRRLTLNVDHASERGHQRHRLARQFRDRAAVRKYVFIYYTKPDPLKPNQNPATRRTA
jgi:hypothetical protein